jgi:subtilisin family serine protease
MRPVAIALLAVSLLTTVASADRPFRAAPRASAAAAPTAESVPGELIVGLHAGGADAKREARVAEIAAAFDLDAVPSRGLARIGAARFRVRGLVDASAVAARLAALPDVAYVEPNILIEPASVPTDPFYAGVNGMPTDQQRWMFNGFGDNRVVNAEQAWDVTKGDPSVVIAVIDSGTDTDNPEFQHLWVNRGEQAGNNLDDDGNGFVDDVKGYDFPNPRGE